MRICIPWQVGGDLAAALSAPAWGIVNWSYVGTSGYRAFTTTYPSTNGMLNRPITGTHPIADTRRVKTYSIVADAAGNVFATCASGNNTTTPGGLTMFPAGGGSPVDFNVSSIEYGVAGTNTACPNKDEVGPCPKGTPGGYVTRLVIGGDGKCYGLQNWNELGTNGSFFGCCGQLPSRILRFNIDGSIDVIVEYSPILSSSNRISGFTKGGDGHVYYWLGGPSNSIGYDWDGSGPDPLDGQYFKKHVLWRYNTQTAQIEESPTSAFATRTTYNCTVDATPFNEGAEITYSRSNIEWIGRDNTNADFFGIIPNTYSSMSRKSWLSCITLGAVADVNGDSRRRYTFGTAFDSIRQKLWVGGQGLKSGGPDGMGTMLMTRYSGTPGTATFNNAATDTWHANGNNTDSSGVGNGSPYWASALAVNPSDGRGWVAWSGHIGCATCGSSGSDGDYAFKQDYVGVPGQWGKLGYVYSSASDVGNNINTTGANEGRPMDSLTGTHAAEANHENFVVGLHFSGGKVYALCLDVVNGRYHVFSGTAGNCNLPGFDADGDGDVDEHDFGKFQACYGQPTNAPNWVANCLCFDKDGTPGVGDADFTKFKNCAELSPINGPFGGTKSRDKVPAVAGCDQ